MFCQVLRTIDRAMLPPCTAEREHQIGKFPLDVSLNMGIGKVIYIFQKLRNTTILFEEILYLLVKSGKMEKMLILSGIVNPPAIENISTSIPCNVVRDPFLVGETVYSYFELLFISHF